MSGDVVSINVPRAHAASSGLIGLASLPGEMAPTVSAAAIEGDFIGEASATVALLHELESELSLLGTLYSTRADLAVAADNFPSLAAYEAFVGNAREALELATGALVGSLSDSTNAAVLGATFVASLGTDVVEELYDFLAGDAINYWNGGDDGGFPYGQLAAAAVKTARIVRYGYRAGPFPVFNTGRVGTGLAGMLSRFPATARAGTWMTGATPFFTKVGIVGGTIATAQGAWNLYQQGNPIDAFQAEGAGYVADVAGTGFAASSTLLLAFPAAAPVLVPIVVGTAIVWAGAEVWDRWGDDISAWTGERLDEFTESMSMAWDVGTAGVNIAADAAADTATAVVDTTTAVVGATWDVGASIVSETRGTVVDAGGAVIDAGGDLLDLGGDLVSAADPRNWF